MSKDMFSSNLPVPQGYHDIERVGQNDQKNQESLLIARRHLTNIQGIAAKVAAKFRMMAMLQNDTLKTGRAVAEHGIEQLRDVADDPDLFPVMQRLTDRVLKHQEDSLMSTLQQADAEMTREAVRSIDPPAPAPEKKGHWWQ